MKVNLGCGPRPIEGFVNVDLLELPGVDVHADVRGPLPFEDGSVDLLYASHVLEHLATAEVPETLREWRRVLRPGGSLLVAVPDLDLVARHLVEFRGWFTPPHNPWLGLIYGGQKDEYDFHRTGFTAPWLAALLTEAGFGTIERVDWFAEVMLDDLSQIPLPFGRNASLNVRATAGGVPPDPRLLRRGAGERAFDSLDRVLSLALRGSARLRSTLMGRRRRRLERGIGAPPR